MGPPSARGSLGSAAILALAVFATPARANATDYAVTGDTAFQAYQVASPWGDTVLDRRRLTQTLGLAVYDIQGKHQPGAPEFNVELRFRLNADFGINGQLNGAQAGGETSFAAANGQRFVPGLAEAPLDLMYGFVEGRNLANGWFGFKLGRQYVSDVLGWWAFDGGLVRLTTPFYVEAEVYGGLEERGGLPLSSSRFESQGVWRGSHSGYNGTDAPSLTTYPSYQFAEPAPAFGFAVQTSGVSFVHGRFDYRRVYNTGGSITTQFPDALGGYHLIKNTRISQERLGYAADINKPNLGGLKGGFTYDLYNQIVGSYYGGAEAYLGQHVMLGADVDYYVPTFDADSIWNWFNHFPVTTFSGRIAVDATKRFAVAASGGARLWGTEGDPKTFGAGEANACKNQGVDPRNCLTVDPSYGPVQTYSQNPANRNLLSTADFLGNLSARYRWPSGDVGLRGMIETGARGKREGGDLSSEKRFEGGRYSLGARASLYTWNDVLRPDRDATSFGYVLAAGWRPASFANARVEWEHDMNRLVGQRFRVLALVNLLVMK